MAKELKMMSFKELNELKEATQLLADKYSKQLLTHGISDTEAYLNNLTESQRDILEKRIKMVKLLSKIDKVIEDKISVYYDELS